MKGNKSVLIRIPPEMHERLKREAEKAGKSMSRIVYEAVRAWLDRKERIP